MPCKNGHTSSCLLFIPTISAQPAILCPFSFCLMSFPPFLCSQKFLPAPGICSFPQPSTSPSAVIPELLLEGRKGWGVLNKTQCLQSQSFTRKSGTFLNSTHSKYVLLSSPRVALHFTHHKVFVDSHLRK